MMKKLFDVSFALERLFYPWNLSCVRCGDEHVGADGFCAACGASLPRPQGERCSVCGNEITHEGLCKDCLSSAPSFSRVFFPFSYQGTVRELIHDFKFHNKRYLSHVFAPFLLEAIDPTVLQEVSFIVPVPLSPARRRDRGFNQALLLSRDLSRLTGLPIRQVLTRTGKGRQMARLTREERLKNVRNLYACGTKLGGAVVLLVDDITTTGATMSECARMLKKAGAKTIYCAAVAHTDLD